MKQRVVFDTSTLVGAVLRANSVPDHALEKALEFYDVCVSDELVEELDGVLGKKRFERYISFDTRRAFVASLLKSGLAIVVGAQRVAKVQPKCRDSRDNFILALAREAQADVIVSSDRDLLVLHPWNEIPVLTPAQFVEQF